MRTPIYRSRPVEPNPARLGGQRINDFILLSEAFSNCYLIETDDESVQINAGMGIEAKVIEANFKSFSKKSLHSLIITQGHVDHLGGVQHFRDKNPGLRVIAGANNAEHQSYDARLSKFRGDRSAFAFTNKFMAIFEYYQKQGYDDYASQDTPTPDLLVTDKYCFEQGGMQFEIVAVPGAETNDSVIIWLPQHKICFTGNLFGCPFGHFPNLVTIRGDRYRDALVVANAVDTVRKLEPEIICYGHHAPIIGRSIIKSELDALFGAIHYVHDEVVAGMNSGRSVHDLMASINLPPHLEVGQGYGKVSWSVRAIWEYYAGWFHHQSTTELFNVPQSAVHTDLIDLAGGVDAILQRATSKFEQGQHEEAIHLLDIIRSTTAGHEASQTLYIDIHKTLLDKSENFWLSSWLKNQIDAAS